MSTRRVIVANLGTVSAPEPEAVRVFLEQFLGDPMVVDYPRWLWMPFLRGVILRSRPRRVAEHYRSIWTPQGSPLAVGTRRIVTGLTAAAEGRFLARMAYRYGRPSLRDEIHDAAGDGAAQIVVVPLFPQRTMSTTGTIEELTRGIGRELDGAARLRVWHIPPDDSGYIDALADRWARALAEGDATPQHLIISFHGIPVRHDRTERRRYRGDCERTAHAFLERIQWPAENATIAYQSRFGPEPWVGPPTEAILKRLPRTGVRIVAVLTPGFLTEGLETLEEIGIGARHTFLEAGGEHYLRVPCVEDHPAFVRSLADSVAAL